MVLRRGGLDTAEDLARRRHRGDPLSGGFERSQLAADYEDQIRRAQERETAAQQQLQRGVYQTQQGLAQQAAMGGAGAERAALYGGGQIGAQARGGSAALSAQEEQQARDLYMQALQGTDQQRFAAAQQQLMGGIIGAQHSAAMGDLGLQEQAQNQQLAGTVAGGLAAAGGAAMSTPSDRRKKRKVRPMGGGGY